MPEAHAPIRVIRVIARMNLGGPAHHVLQLNDGFDPHRYETLLVTGRVGPGEEEFPLVGEVRRIDSLGPDIRPLADLRSLIALIRIVRAYRPGIIETHTSKAGFLGRVAALCARGDRPVVIHTFHGHVLRGYFGPAKSRAYLFLERALARVSDLLVAVSEATVDELVELGVAPRSKFAVVPLGLPLESFFALAPHPGGAFREELGAAEGDTVFTFTGRLVPIKRPEEMLRSVAIAASRGAAVRVAVVGDGELRPRLERMAIELSCSERVHFLGYRRDLTRIAAGSDAALLTSANEGTPVALIEAAAAGRPAVATAVGGVGDIVVDGTGMLVAPGNEEAIADAIVELSADPERRIRMGAAAREHVRERFPSARLIARVEALYEGLLASRGHL